MAFIDRCKDINCLRDDHVICPVKICFEILHSSINIKKCSNIRCISKDHLKCPSCGTTFHMELIKI